MKVKSKKAFTLVEILVVVLIIGILTAVAIPMYQSAVDKTHWSTLLPTARALKNAEEAYLMATNAYTSNEEELDVSSTPGDATYQLQMPDSAARYVIRGSTTKLPNVRLAQYLEDNASYADLLFCEAATDDDRANKLCEKTLNGQKVFTTGDSYNAYLMDSPCRKGTNYLENDKCGFEDTQGKTVGKGEVCIGNATQGCKGSTIENGGVCVGNGAQPGGFGACSQSTVKEGGVCEAHARDTCKQMTIEAGGTCISYTTGAATCGYGGTAKPVQGTVICNEGGTCGINNTYDGGICVGNKGQNCVNSTYNNGSICYANSAGACGGLYSTQTSSYDDTSCCCGNHCPSYAPSCASRGKTCEAQYMQ